MDVRRVPDTLPYSTSIITQTSPVSPPGERHPKVAPASRDLGLSQQERSCLSPCLSTRPCIILRKHVSRSEAERDILTDSQHLQSECVHFMSTFQDGDSPIGTCSRVPFRLDFLDRSQGRVSPCTDSSWFIQISAVGSDADKSVSLQSSPLRVKYSTTDIHSHSGRPSPVI